MAQAAAGRPAGKATSHRRVAPLAAVASVVPSRQNATGAPGAAAGSARPGVIGEPIRCPVATLHRDAVPPAPTVARVLPPGLNASASWRPTLIAEPAACWVATCQNQA